MKITLIPLAFPPAEDAYQYLTSYVVNDSVAIDAGAIGFYRGPAEQAAIRHVFLSHSHMDHLASLPIFLDNISGSSQTPVTLHASEAVHHSLRLDVFNDRVWPNFLELSHGNVPFVRLNSIQSGEPVLVEGLRITPVAVHHTVPTLGFIVEDQNSAVIVVSDTGPTQEIWDRASQTPNLKAVFLEATFPDDRAQLAEISMHLTPASFVGEMQKLPRAVPFFAVHLKSRFRAQVTEQLLSHHLSCLAIAQFGTAYEF